MSTYLTLKMALPFPELKKRRKKKTFLQKTLPTAWLRVQCLTDFATWTFNNKTQLLSLNKTAAVLHVSVRQERFRINFWLCQRIKLSKMAYLFPSWKREGKKEWAKKKTFVKKRTVATVRLWVPCLTDCATRTFDYTS